MFINEKNLYRKDFCHVVINGGLGDAIMATPVVKWAKENIWGETGFLISCPETYDFIYRDLFGKRVNQFSEVINWGNHATLKRIFPTPGFAPRTNLSRFFSFSLLGKILPDKFLSLPKLPLKEPTQKILNHLNLNDIKEFKEFMNKSVVIPVSFRVESKSWNVDLLNNFILYLLDKNYKVILVGGKKENDHPLVKGYYVSKYIGIEKIKILSDNLYFLVGEISIEETLILMQYCSFIVSITGGLVQLAALTNNPVLCLTTYTDIFHSLYWRDEMFAGNTWCLEPSENKCRYCVNKVFVYQTDYNRCIFKKNYECKDFEFNRLIEKFEQMEKGIPCDVLENFRKKSPLLQNNFDMNLVI